MLKMFEIWFRELKENEKELCLVRFILMKMAMNKIA